jgi:hypothetical protein
LKWVGLAMLLAAILPLSRWLRQNPGHAPKLWMLLGFLPFALSFLHLDMAFISWVTWPGYVKGAEFTVLDALAIALYLSLPATKYRLPFRLPMAFYLFATVVSASWAWEPLAALFYSWQVIRVFFVYATVARGCSDSRVPLAIFKGMTAGLVVELVVAIWQRFGEGILQTPGTMSAQNLLGMMTHFVCLPIFALLLSGEAGWIIAAVPIGLAVVVLTTSRGALGFALLGYTMIFVFSSLRKWTFRKQTVLIIGMLGSFAMIPIASSSFQHRFARQAELIASNYDERAAFERAASMMLSDNPLGQGGNNYVMAANLGGYNQRAGVAPVSGSEGADVHNVYFLVAAETGYLGLFTFMLLLLRPMSVALLCGWSRPGDRRGDLLLGLGIALLIVYVHGLFEWIFVLLETQYMFALDVGMIAGLACQLGYWGRVLPPQAALIKAKPSTLGGEFISRTDVAGYC